MILSPHSAVQEPSGLHAPTWWATEQEYLTILYWAIIANNLRNILEIGTYLGHSTWWWVEAAKKINGRVLTVDKKMVAPLPYDSHYLEQVEALSDSVWRDGINYDFIYVDGWHGYDQAYKDIVNAGSHLNSGGIIAVHDTGYDNGEVVQVRKALDDAIKVIGGSWMHFSQGKGLSIGEF